MLRTEQFLLEVELASGQTPLVNQDAAWLMQFADELDQLEDNPSEESMRLRYIAGNLERLDEKLRNLSTNDSYSAGIMEGQRRILAHSNLPPQPSEYQRDLRKLITAHPVTRVPKGMRALDESQPPRKPKLNIKFDLSLLKPKG